MRSFVAASRGDPATTGVFVDFDGTLAAIIDDPADARPVEDAVDTLVAAGRTLGVVAVVSGRPLDFLDPIFPDNIHLVGLYGLEQRVDGRRSVDDRARSWAPVISEVVAEARNLFPSGSVEAKGLSLTVHHRRHPGLAGEMKAWAGAVARSRGLDARPARRAFELHPPIDADKGTIVAELSRGLHRVAYVGDDAGDIPAFGALDHLANGGVVTLRLAVAFDEADPDLIALADHVLDGPLDVVRFVQSLTAAN